MSQLFEHLVPSWGHYLYRLGRTALVGEDYHCVQAVSINSLTVLPVFSASSLMEYCNSSNIILEPPYPEFTHDMDSPLWHLDFGLVIFNHRKIDRHIWGKMIET